MAQGPRGLAAFLFFLALSSTVRARKEVFVVEGANHRNGLYAEEGHGSTKHYKRLGGASSHGNYYYLYQGTEQRGTWLLGYGENFETREALYRAPAVSAAGQPPLVIGWRTVPGGSKDGGESGSDEPNVRVTGFQLDEKGTAAGVLERGGGEMVEGIICKTGVRGDVFFYCLAIGLQKVKYSFAQSNVGRVYIHKG